MTDQQTAPPRRAPPLALTFIFITVMMNSVGIGLMMPVMPDLLLDLSTGGASIGEAAAIGGWLAASFALMQFLFSPTIGNLSDAYGRRPVLLISLLIAAVDYLIMALTPSLALLFVARIMAGVASSTYSTANAFIADISPPDQRAQNFGLSGAAFGVGFVLGPAIGGFLGEFGPRAPFFAAAALTLATFIFGFFTLPESLPPEKRRRFRLGRANTIGVALQMRKHPAVAWLLVALLIYNVAHYVYPAVWSYYVKERYAWTPFDIGLSLALVGIGFAIVQGFLIRRIIPWLGAARTAILGLGLDVLALIGIALAPNGVIIYAMVPIAALSAIVTPALQGLMSNLIPDDAQGELQGAVSALTSLSFVLSPLLMTQLFVTFTSSSALPYIPGAPFFAAAAFSAVAIAPVLFGLMRRPA